MSTSTPDVPAPPEYGAVFTRRWVVEFILDLCGYTASVDLTRLHAVEPAVGQGAFLNVMIDRLLDARRTHRPEIPWAELASCISAWDLQDDHVLTCRQDAVRLLTAAGCPEPDADALARGWIRPGDFLLEVGAHRSNPRRSADVVVGNPPYIRIEDLEPDLLRAYRKACPTMGGRADIYVGFFEHSLDLLAPGGRLGFICADRWMRNQYGRRLREKIVTQDFAVDVVLEMHDARAFEEEVSAYPAITVMSRSGQRTAVAGRATESFDADAAQRLLVWLSQPAEGQLADSAVTAARLPHWHTTSDSWPEGSPEMLAWLELLDEKYPLLESPETGVRVGIGVATGADGVYVTTDATVAEGERMLPLSMASDISSGEFRWGRRYLVNPWDADGLVDLERWPRTEAYLSANSAVVLNRAVAKKNVKNWFRTIDRVNLSLLDRPMLLLQDMKSRIHPVLAPMGFYPHHNLYYLVSDNWELEALGGLLLSEVVERQVEAYCVKMRGKTLRFQAQYLRRVRVPAAEAVPEDVRAALRAAFRHRDRAAATIAALRAYEMSGLPA